MNNNFTAVIMAGGDGKRFDINKIKVLHEVFDKPMIVHIINTIQNLNPTKILIIVGKYYEQIKSTITKYIEDTSKISYVLQNIPKGTGDALKCCIPELKLLNTMKVLILSGDTPMIQMNTIKDILDKHSKVTIVIRNTDIQLNAGRILLNDNKEFIDIVEEKDATEIQKQITLVNTGIYCIDANIIADNLEFIQNKNSQNEYYLTDLFKIIKNKLDINIDLYELPKEKLYEVIGINTTDDLNYLYSLF